MAEAIFTIPVTGTISIERDSITIRIKESILTVKIEGKEAGGEKRLQMERGRTLFDIVLDTAKTFIEETGEDKFSAADLYHMAVERNPGLSIKRNSWGAHVVSSASNHPSYHHYTARRRYFRYLGKGKYSIEPGLLS